MIEVQNAKSSGTPFNQQNTPNRSSGFRKSKGKSPPQGNLQGAGSV